MSRPAYLTLVLLFCLTWSSAFPGAKLAIGVAPPLLFLGIRFGLAALLLLGWAKARGLLRGPIPWLTLFALGLLNQAFYQGLAWLGVRTVSSGLATIITSLNPILIAAFAVPVLGEAMTSRKLGGLVLGFAGAAFVVRNRIVVSGEDPGGILLLLAALASVTAGTLAFKRLVPSVSLVVAVGAQQLAAGAVLLAWGLATESVADIHWGWSFGLLMGWFVIVVSIGAFLLWFLLLRRGTASSASSLHFLMPPLGLLLSWAVLGERLNPLDLLGVAPVAAGIWLATRTERATALPVASLAALPAGGLTD